MSEKLNTRFSQEDKDYILSNILNDEEYETYQRLLDDTTLTFEQREDAIFNFERKILDEYPEDGYKIPFTTSDGTVMIVTPLTNPPEFKKALEIAKSTYDSDKIWRVDIPSNSYSNYKDCKMYLTENGSTVAVNKNGDIISVCANSTNNPKDKGKHLMEFAVSRNGDRLDSYDGNYGFYRKCGFVPISYCEFDENFAPDDWNGIHEKIIFFGYANKQTKYVRKQDFYADKKNKVSKDYGAAEEKRDKVLSKEN